MIYSIVILKKVNFFKISGLKVKILVLRTKCVKISVF